MHTACSELYFQIGSGRMICQSNGKWKYDIVCGDKTGVSQHINMKCWMIPWNQSFRNIMFYYLFKLFCFVFFKTCRIIFFVEHVLWKNTIIAQVFDDVFLWLNDWLNKSCLHSVWQWRINFRSKTGFLVEMWWYH